MMDGRLLEMKIRYNDAIDFVDLLIEDPSKKIVFGSEGEKGSIEIYWDYRLNRYKQTRIDSMNIECGSTFSLEKFVERVFTLLSCYEDVEIIQLTPEYDYEKIEKATEIVFELNFRDYVKVGLPTLRGFVVAQITDPNREVPFNQTFKSFYQKTLKTLVIMGEQND